MWLTKKMAEKSTVIPINCRNSDTLNFGDIVSPAANEEEWGGVG
jgi:hypothetical protein